MERTQQSPEENIDRDARKVIVGLSGGVDSAVTAFLLKQQGYDVSAIFMKNWDDDDGTEWCTANDDFLSACEVAAHLDIAIESVSFSKEYKEQVFARFLTELERGLTPNPDVACNSEIKFEAFAHHALALGADMIATGHYARIVHNDDDSVSLRTALDSGKDQTYFLHQLNQEQLRKAIFPLGELQKSEVRAIAREQGLPNAERKDSTGICFIGERDFSDFVQRYLPAQEGDMVDDSGRVVGRHKGVHLYTIGQRKGLGIGGLADASEQPWYVAAKDTKANRLIVVQGEHPLLYRDTFVVEQVHWIEGKPALPWDCTVKIRHQQKPVPCRIDERDDNALVIRCASQRAVTPGQYAVLYSGDLCLGGGSISDLDQRFLSTHSVDLTWQNSLFRLAK